MKSRTVQSRRIALPIAVFVAAVLAAGAWAATSTPLSTGPNGEKAAAASSVTLTPSELAKVKAMHATAAIALHYGGNDWSTAQVAGLTHEFGVLGIKLIAVTDAHFVASQQVSDIETLITRKPNIIVSIPVDPVATAAAYMKAYKAGIKLVFMDNVPQGFKAGVEYISDVSADNYGNGIASAKLLGAALHGKGTLGVVYYSANFFVTHERYLGFVNTIKKDYPGIKIVAQQGIPGPNFPSEAETAANAILTRYPTLTAMWGVWDVPTTGILSAAKADGRTNLVVATEDLGLDDAIPLAEKQNICCIGAQRPFDQGVTEAKLAAYGLLGKKAPAYVALPSLPVNHANVLQSWQTVYHAPAPASLKKAYKP